MGISISNVLGKPRTVTKDFDGEELRVSYQAGVISPEWMAEQQAKAAAIASQGDDDSAGLAAQVFGAELIALMLSEVVVEWNLEDDGKPVPTDYATLRKLGIGVTGAIWALIQDDAGELGNAGSTSDAGSR